MSIEEIKEYLEEVERLIDAAMKEAMENDELKYKREQLRTVKRSIGQLEKKGIPVPKEMQDLKIHLVSELENIHTPEDGLTEIYDRCLALIMELGHVCQRTPHRDLYLLSLIHI